MLSFASFIAESQESVLYHGTNIHNAVKILESGILLKTNSKQRYHDGIEGISLTRSLEVAGDYGVIFIIPKSKLAALDVRPHTNTRGEQFKGRSEEEEKVFLPKDLKGISVTQHVSGFKIHEGYLATSIKDPRRTMRFSGIGSSAKKSVEFLVKHPLYRGTYR